MGKWKEKSALAESSFDNVERRQTSRSRRARWKMAAPSGSIASPKARGPGTTAWTASFQARSPKTIRNDTAQPVTLDPLNERAATPDA